MDTRTRPRSVGTVPSSASRRFGYFVSVLINVAMLIVVNNLVTWDILPFLTGDFDRVVPIITVSLGAAILANLAYIAYDAGWFRSLTQIGLLLISLAATIRLYQVFPFDFAAYEFNWTAVGKGVLILAMVGVVVGMITEAVKLAQGTSNS